MTQPQQPQGNRNGIHGADGATFEQSFSRLQEVVQKLSAGNLTLQEALAAFEEGMALAERCQVMLDQAQLRIKQVSARAARAGEESVARLEASARDAAMPGQVAGIEISSIEQRVIIDTGSAPPAAQPGTNPAARSPWEGRSTGQPAPGPQMQRPPQPLRPPQQQAGADEDKYAENLDLDALFDDED